MGYPQTAKTTDQIPTLKVLVPMNSLIPNFFSNIMENLVPKVESYLVSFECEVSCAKCVFFKRNQLKFSWKLENVVVSIIYKTRNNMNIAFSDCLQMRCIFAFFPHFFSHTGNDNIDCKFEENS